MIVADASLPAPPSVKASRPQPPPRRTPLLSSPSAVALGGCCVAIGASLSWWHPWPETTIDLALAPLVAVLIHVLVARWCDRRGAAAAVVMYAALLAVWLLVSKWPAAMSAWPDVRFAARNLSCGGSAQLLVGLGSLCLLESLALPLWLWSATLVAASVFQPQFTFVPLLMMTLLRSRTILVIGFVDKARAAALRCAALCLVALLAKRALVLGGPIRVDSVTLPLAWWTASWLLDGEALMPHFARVLLSGILCIATVADFRAWPALGLVLLCAFVFTDRTRGDEKG